MKRKNKYCKISEKEIEKAFILFEQGNSLTRIANLLNIDRRTISKKLKEKGYSIIRNNKKDVDSKYFDNLNKESAYWLGYIFADGYLSDDGRLEICSKDKEHIEKFKQCIKSNHTINIKKVDNKNYYRINIQDKRIAEQLRKYGVNSNKSYGWKMPIIKDELYNHFIRGLIDGDGTISNRSKNTLDIRLCSYSEEVLKDIKSLINRFIEIEQHSTISITSTRIPSLRINNHDTQVLFLEWLYKDCNVYLDRKYKNALYLLPS